MFSVVCPFVQLLTKYLRNILREFPQICHKLSHEPIDLMN